MKTKVQNIFRAQFAAKSVNEGWARQIVSAFVTQLDPQIAELADIRTAVSEAVTNAIVHGYKNGGGIVFISVSYSSDRIIRIVVRDKGCGIEDVKAAMRPLFTTDKTGERGGMGFTIMKSFTDKLRVTSRVGKGTIVTMTKRLSAGAE
jgi:stage II sporulation protein AB (anti-sigma F factor)